jgi:hypothetical protein
MKIVNPKLKYPLESGFGLRKGDLKVWGATGLQARRGGQATAPGKRSATGRKLQAGERWTTQLSTAGELKRGLLAERVTYHDLR